MLLAECPYRGGDLLRAVIAGRGKVDQLEVPGGEVLVREDLPHLRGVDLATLAVGVSLDDVAELDLQPPRQVEMMVDLHDVSDAALTGLRVHPDDRLVRA